MKTYRITSLILGLTVAAAFNAGAQDLKTGADSLKVPANLMETSAIRNTAAVSTVSGEELYESATPNLTNTLSGKLPGLFIVKGDGTPGYGTSKMFIRGIGSYAQSTDLSTLKYYVDGFEVKPEYIEFLTPEEISTVSVFKDAAALATFGMNGANGVLWIETKRGNAGAPVVSFQTRTGVQQPINVAKPLGSYEYAYFYNQAVSNDNGRVWTPQYDNETLNAYWYGQGTDVSWYDEVFKNNGMYTDGVLSFRGGSDQVRYNVVLDYANQQGLFNVKNTDQTSNATYAKYGVRTNFDMNFGKVLTVKMDIGGRLEDRTRPNYDMYTLTQNVLNYPSNIYPIYDEASTDPISKFSGTAVYPDNPVASLTGLGWTTSRTKVLQANFKFIEDLDFLLDGLYLEEGFSFYSRSIGNTGKTRTYARYINGVAQTDDQSTYIRSNGYWTSGKERWMQGNVTLGYGNTFGLNAVNAALNAHISDYTGMGSAFYNWKYHFINYNGKVNYAYDNRYIAELAFSYFGSDAYAPGNRYGFFPAGSLAWVVSNESFLKDSDVVKLLKVRGSAGLSGSTEANVAISGFETNGRYLYQQYYANGGSFITGLGPSFGGGGSGLVPLFIANPDVTAEKSLKLNAGIDMNLFDKLSITADYFIDKRSGILTLDNTRMDYNGTNVYYSNIGRMTNQGVDGNITFTDKIGEFSYSVFGNAVYAKNTVDFMGEVPPKYAYNAATGRPLGTRMGLTCIGFYQVNDFNLDGSLKKDLPTPLFGSVQPGDLKYMDWDGDGYVDETDISEIGGPGYPKLQFSVGADFEYKGFDFSFLFTGSAGGTVNLLDYSAWKPFLNYGNIFEWARGAWAYYPEQNIDTREYATFPRLTTGQNDNNYRSSSFWIRKNDYIRLQNVEVGYDLANLRAVRNAGITKCRLYINALNLLTFSNLLNECKMDPETAYYGYPALKSANVGVQISF